MYKFASVDDENVFLKILIKSYQTSYLKNILNIISHHSTNQQPFQRKL